MRRVFVLSFLCLTAGVMAGCGLKEEYLTEVQPTAGVRFINAVPDTAGALGMDLRWVDQVENNAHFRQNFRNGPTTSAGVTASVGVQFKPVRAGSRRFNIFLDDTLQSLATVVIKDTTVSLVAGKNYTAILWGYARAGAAPSGPTLPMRLTFFEETVADPGATLVAVRVINATPNRIDVRAYPSTGVLPGAPTWANMAPLSVSSHVTMAPAQVLYNVQPAGGGATPFVPALTLIGAAASSTAGAGARLDLEALPGTTIAGSATTYIVFPQSNYVAPRVAKHLTTTAGNTNRTVASIVAVAGGFQLTDSVATVASPGWVASQFVATPFGYTTVTIKPPSSAGLPPITVFVTGNGTTTLTTAVDLSAYVGPFLTRARYDVAQYLTGGSSVWDRRPPYIP